MNGTKVVRIGCGSGFWGDSDVGPAQLVERGNIDYLVFDYLAEITMSLLARARQKDPDAGYVGDFVSKTMRRLLPDIVGKNIRVVANAGGVNPRACRAALEHVARELGIAVRIAVVSGDDVSDRLDDMRARGVREMFDGREMPAETISANAYLGAVAISDALDAGAQIVITGRCVDSAVVLGPLIHEFGWKLDDYDRLSAGTLLGHLLECGCQVTGGVFSDWEDVPAPENVGFPIAECFADGTGVLTKPQGTGGLVSRATVAEQMLYEIGDPRRYVCPDVVCDWTQVSLQEDGVDRVRISGAKGACPTTSYKVSATHQDGWRATTTLVFAGGDAGGKARRTARAILDRSARLCGERGLEGFAETSVELVGAGEMSGAVDGRATVNEVMLKIAVRHRSKQAVEVFCHEVMPALTAMAPGIAGYFSGRPKPVPVVRLFSFLMPKTDIDVSFDLGEGPVGVDIPPGGGMPDIGPAVDPLGDGGVPAGRPGDAARTVNVPLRRLAYARSGDKGDMVNIGVIARNEASHAILRQHLTADRVARFFAHYVRGQARRYSVPGISGFNFVLEEALGGGGIASLRIDPQGKCFGPLLLDLELALPEDVVRAVGCDGAGSRTP